MFCRQVLATRMAIFSANSGYQVAIHLQSRTLLIPWAEKKVGCVKCSKGRDYSSSFPVRYVPKKTLDCEESEAFRPATEQSDCAKKCYDINSNIHRVSHNAHILDNRQTFGVETKFQNWPNKRMNFEVGLGVAEDFDGDELFEDVDIVEEPEEVTQDASEEKEKSTRIQVSIIKQDVENVAVEILATRAFTASELRKKLLRKHFPPITVDEVIMDFQKRGLVNDSFYAETYSRSRWSTSTWGPRRIKKALLDKGVNKEDVETAVKLVFRDTKSTQDEDLEFGMSQHSMDHLFAQASKQWQRCANVSRETRKSRIIRWLQYRGFGWSIIGVVLKKLESDHRL